jgi:hypothetical protein
LREDKVVCLVVEKNATKELKTEQPKHRSI